MSPVTITDDPLSDATRSVIREYDIETVELPKKEEMERFITQFGKEVEQ